MKHLFKHRHLGCYRITVGSHSNILKNGLSATISVCHHSRHTYAMKIITNKMLSNIVKSNETESI